MRPHAGHQVRRDHPGDFARDGKSGEALALQCVSAQCEPADQNREHKLKRINFRMSQRQLDESQNHERDAKEHAVVPGEIYARLNVQEPRFTVIAPTTPIAYRPASEAKFAAKSSTTMGRPTAMTNGHMGTPCRLS
jgi:hypothetical protein